MSAVDEKTWAELGKQPEKPLVNFDRLPLNCKRYLVRNAPVARLKAEIEEFKVKFVEAFPQCREITFDNFDTLVRRVHTIRSKAKKPKRHSSAPPTALEKLKAKGIL